MKSHLRITIETLLSCGVGQREIARRTGVDRKTIRRYATLANSPGVATGSNCEFPVPEQSPPPRPPATESPIAPPITPSACEPHRAWIESQVQLGRNAVSIYQDLVERHGFSHQYNALWETSWTTSRSGIPPRIAPDQGASHARPRRAKPGTMTLFPIRPPCVAVSAH